MDAGSTAHDVAYIIKDCKPVCVWTSRTKIDVVREAMELAGVTIDVFLIDDFEQAPAPEEKAVIETRLEDTALIIYTSGTTGSPKGVMLSFGNIEANIHAVSEEVSIFNEERCTLVLLPLHHLRLDDDSLRKSPILLLQHLIYIFLTLVIKLLLDQPYLQR